MLSQSEKRGTGHYLAGYQVGVLVLKTRHRLLQGNLQHARTFNFPVLYEVVEGMNPRELMCGAPEALPAILNAVDRLQQAGVGAIVGACGSFANYQQEVRQHASVPVFLSVLLLVPLILSGLPANKRLGIIFASASSFTDRVQREMNIRDAHRLVILSADALPTFQPVLLQESSLDHEGLRRELVALTCDAQRSHPDIAAWLLQCSDLPPYADSIRQATGLPVFDGRHLVELMARVLPAHDRSSEACTWSRA